jgi:predicted TIM-barrel fold metal-dependent hydrolase
MVNTHVVNKDWISQLNEPPLEPDLPIIDPHHHFWVRPDPDQTYVLDDLILDVAGHNVRQTVFIECNSMYRGDGELMMAPVGETEYVQGIAAQSASGQFGDIRAAAGIVGFADLTLGEEVTRVLDAQIAASPNRFRGIRHQATWDSSEDVPNSRINPPESLFLSQKFREGFSQLEKYSLSFEAWLYHTQIEELKDLANHFPNTTIILNHLGGPIGIGPYAKNRASVFSEWKSAISSLAQCPNVYAKVGGIQMPVNGFGWEKLQSPPTSDELLAINRPWYSHIIEVFGPSRCMFESNFPVDKQSCSYSVLWNQFKKLAQDFSEPDRDRLFHDTALEVYKLNKH